MFSKETIREVILEQEKEIEETFKKEKIIERELLEELPKFLNYPNILAILGVRRCGKSVLSWQVLKDKKFGYINFDDERLKGLKADDLNKFLQVFYELYGDLENIILDEIHNIDGWELFANRLRRTKKVIITGSNSKLLSGELATHLTGRHIDFTLFPFSFREFLIYNNIKLEVYTTLERAQIFNHLQNYLFGSGFPEFPKFGKKILKVIYEDIIKKDVAKRRKIKREEELRKIARFLVSNFSKEFTYSSLKEISTIKHLFTISTWVNALEEAYLIIKLERFSFKLKQKFIAPKKVYCIDNGLISVAGFLTSENIGRLMENLVAIELFRKKSYWFDDWEIFYWKDYQQNEVDFIVKEGLKINQLIQVTYASSKDEIDKREIKALLKASEQLKCENLLIITWDYEDELKVNNKTIKCIPLWKWLLKF
ncbi:MAG: ATP-binding protein [Candidatus Aenigmatarchaeota archaeon]